MLSQSRARTTRCIRPFAAGKWNMRDATARAALKALQEGKKIKLEYESPWYWLVGISGAARPAEAPKPKQRKTKIDLSPSTEAESKASYDLSAQQDEELAPPRLQRQTNQPNLDDPIVARALAGNSPTIRFCERRAAGGELAPQRAGSVLPSKGEDGSQLNSKKP